MEWMTSMPQAHSVVASQSGNPDCAAGGVLTNEEGGKGLKHLTNETVVY